MEVKATHKTCKTESNFVPSSTGKYDACLLWVVAHKLFLLLGLKCETRSGVWWVYCIAINALFLWVLFLIVVLSPECYVLCLNPCQDICFSGHRGSFLQG
jgi:hypothetical protein